MLSHGGEVCVPPVEVDLFGDDGGVVWVPPVCETFLGDVWVALVIPSGAGSLGDVCIPVFLG